MGTFKKKYKSVSVSKSVSMMVSMSVSMSVSIRVAIREGALHLLVRVDVQDEHPHVEVHFQQR